MMKISFSVLRKLVSSDIANVGNVKVHSYSVLRTTKFRIVRAPLQYRVISNDSSAGSYGNLGDHEGQTNTTTEKVNLQDSNAEETNAAELSKLPQENDKGDENRETSLEKRENTEISEVKPENTIEDGTAKSSKTKDSKSAKTSKKKSDKVSTKELLKSISMEMKEAEHIVEVLNSYKLKFLDGHTCYIVNCLKKSLSRKPVLDEAIYINKTTGCFTCFNCKKHGRLSALKKNFEDITKAKPPKKNFVCFEKDSAVVNSLEVDKNIQLSLTKSLPLKNLTKAQYTEIQNSFGFENITQATVAVHNISYDKEKNALLIPYCHPHDTKVITDCKRLTSSYDEDEEINEIEQSFFPGSQKICLFGWRDEDLYKKTLILTQTEKDALAVQQSTASDCVLSLPRETQLPPEALPYLERFEKIILWFGNDMTSWDTSMKLARKLGDSRCFVFRPDEIPSPHEVLKQKLSIAQQLSKARVMKNEFLTSFKAIRNDVKAEIEHHNQISGVQWKRFVQLNKILKGLRPGELTVMSGRTGCGKTTFMSEYSLDLCMQGVNTLWGSFEVNNVRLAKTMLTQFALKNLTTHLDEFDYYADRFQQLPMYFMTFFGQENVKKVVDTMAHAVYIHDIQHVIVDNLQFMMGEEMATTDRFSKQNTIYAAFRKFASVYNCHVSLVIHPRKESEDVDLTTSSIFGSAKATQEADNVILLQNKKMQVKGKKFIQVTKNRFDGEVGNMTLKFNPENLTLSNIGKTTNTKQKKSTTKKTDILGEDEHVEVVGETSEDETDEFMM